MSRKQREKGKRGERQAAKEIERILGIKAARSAQYCGSTGIADINMGEAFHPEVKLRKSIAAIRFWEQAESDRTPQATPFVLMREDRGPFFLMVKLEDLPKLMKEIDNATEGSKHPDNHSGCSTGCSDLGDCSSDDHHRSP